MHCKLLSSIPNSSHQMPVAIKNIPKHCQVYSQGKNCPSFRTIDTGSAVFLLRFELTEGILEHYNEYLGRRVEGEKKRERERMLNTHSVLRLLFQRMVSIFCLLLMSVQFADLKKFHFILKVWKIFFDLLSFIFLLVFLHRKYLRIPWTS